MLTTHHNYMHAHTDAHTNARMQYCFVSFSRTWTMPYEMGHMNWIQTFADQT